MKPAAPVTRTVMQAGRDKSEKHWGPLEVMLFARILSVVSASLREVVPGLS